MDRKLIIDALIFENGKAYGYQEYLFNLLDYFFENRYELHFSSIMIICPLNQVCYFQKYESLFEIIGMNIENKLEHIIVQNIW